MERNAVARRGRSPRTNVQRRSEAETALLQAAADIIAEKGTEGVTLAEVGKQAGYSRGLPAHYFSDKQGLLIAVVRYIGRRYAEDLAKYDFKPSGADAVTRRIRAAYESALQNEVVPGQGSKGAIALLVSLSESLTDPTMRAPIKAIDDRVLAVLSKELRLAIELGEFRADADPEIEAVILLGTIRGLIWHWNLDPARIDLRALCATHIETFLAGISA